MSSEEAFNLEDLDNTFVSPPPNYVLVDKNKPSPPRKSGVLRSISQKKRKAPSTSTPSAFEGLSTMDTLEKFRQLNQEGSEILYKRVVEVLADNQRLERKIRDATKAAEEKEKFRSHDHQELLRLKKDIKDLRADMDLQKKKTVDSAMKSAAIAVLEAQVKMILEAEVDAPDMKVESWKKDEREASLKRLKATEDHVGTSSAGVEVNKDAEEEMMEAADASGVGDE